MTLLAGKKPKCPNCGAEFEDPVVFCGACGTRIIQRAAAAPPAPERATLVDIAGPEVLTEQEVLVVVPAPDPRRGRPAPPPPAQHARGPAVVPGSASARAPLPPSPSAKAAQAAAPQSPPAKSEPAERGTDGGKRRRKSSRPAAPAITEWGADPNHEQKLLDEVDAGFYSIVQPRQDSVDDDWAAPAQRTGRPSSQKPAAPAAKAHAEPDPVDVAAAVELFEQLAPIYARPLRDFMLEVVWGDASKAWLAVCTPAAKSLRGASDKMDLLELRAALDDFLAALEVIEGIDGAVLGPDAKEMLTGAYDKLVQVMPHVFALEQERGRREPMIVHALMLQVPGVGKVTLDKIYAAGLTRLDMLYAARPDELAVTSGIAAEVARRVCDRIQAYRAEVQQQRPDGGRAADRIKLEALVAELNKLNASFMTASGWSAQAVKDKRHLRSERERIFLEVKVVLARSGEVELLERLERVPFERKADHLERFLRDSRGQGQA
jgi:hypothetical protein